MDADYTLEQVVLLNQMIEKIYFASKERGENASQISTDIGKLKSQQQSLIANLAQWAVSQRLTASIDDLPTLPLQLNVHTPVTVVKPR